jgi:hypothetical protein
MRWPGHGVATTGPRGKRERASTRSRSSIETSTPPKHRGVPLRLCQPSNHFSDGPLGAWRMGAAAAGSRPRRHWYGWPLVWLALDLDGLAICLVTADSSAAGEDLGRCHRGAMLEGLASLAWTRTMTCWPDPVQPTEVKPEPWATPDPAFWLTLTKTSALLVPLQVTSSGTSTAAPRATSLAGDSTWTSRNSPPEKNATAGPEVANSASRPPRTMRPPRRQP